ncbi:MAG: NADH-quinone oxidoreductase subunit M [Cytophagaceae bacterium]|nr:NADH-quinone oxidoreductase subunit M [Cytophagaceae bacterium]
MLTLFLFLIPLIGGLLVINLKSQKSAKMFSGIVSVLQIFLYIYIFINFNNPDFQSQFSYDYKWLSDFDIRFHLGLDGLSILMAGLTVVLSAVVLYFTSTMNYGKLSLFSGLIFFTESALLGLFMAKDIFVFYFFFELALIPIYFMANIWGGKNSSAITFKMFIYTVFGSLFMLIGFVFLFMRGQTADISALKETVALLPEGLKAFLFWGFLLAFAIKMPIFPFHTWQPDVYTESPTPVSMMLSGLLSKMGVYGLIRILIPFGYTGVKEFGIIAIFLGVVGLIYGSIIAIKQNEVKKVIAYSSFAHMGLMASGVLTLSSTGIQGAIFQMLAHGINVVGLFYISKIIYEKTQSRELSGLGGLAKNAPKLAVIFMIFLLGSIALPLTNGFVGEFLLLKSVFDFMPVLGIIAGLSIILGAVYMLRVYQKSMFEYPGFYDLKDIENKHLIVLIPMVVLVFFMGIMPNTILEISQFFTNTLTQIK